MKPAFSLLFISMFFSFSSKAYEVIHSYAELEKLKVPSNSLFVFDLDNTLIHPEDQFGSVQWVEAVSQILKDKKLPSTNEKEYALFGYIQHQIQLIATEEKAPSILADLRKKGQRVIALTARSAKPDLVEVTKSHIKKIGYDFDKPKDEVIKNFSFKMEDGIIFASGQNKGKILAEYIKVTGIKPERILFFDDKIYNVKNVEEEGQIGGIKTQVFWYKGVQNKVDSLNLIKTEKEYAQYCKTSQNCKYE